MEGEIKYDDISKVETEQIPIIDPGVGKEVVLRHFFFKAQPRPKGMPKPTKLELVSYFKRLIEISLWGDGLIIMENKPIEVHTRQSVKKVSKALYAKMREEGADFVILCLATARMGQSVLETAHKL